jgi:HEAT repeat protein
MASCGDPEYQAWAVASLIRLGDVSAISDAVTMLNAGPRSRPDQQLRALLARAVEEARNPDAVGTLAGALKSDDVTLRRAAVRALRAIRDPRGSPALAAALDDPDADVRYDALLGLAVIEGGGSEMAPARDFFDRDESRYISRRKAWLRDRRPQQ